MGHGRRAIFAGFWGGLLAGALDGGATLLASPNPLGHAGRFHLLVMDAGLGAFAGSALAIVFLGWSLGLERLLGTSRWFSGTHAVALLLALPLLVYDAFALFAGARASRIPAHRLISVLLIVLGAGCVWAAVTLWTSLLARSEPGGHPGECATGGDCREGRRGPMLAIGLGFILASVAAGWINHHVLPRLYHWFHLSLALAGLVFCVLAVRLLLGMGRRVLGRRWSLTLGVVAAALLLGGAMVERPILARSQSLRFFVYEKTQLASLFARLLSTTHQATTQLVDANPASEPLLPEGPHRPDSDVVLITIDALRADHLGCYGYPRAISPNIDALAAQSVRIDRAYTQAPHTSFALASLMIGKYYPTLARLAPSDTHETLASILRRYEWKTAAFFPPAVFYVDAHKMKAFESHNFDFEYVKYEYLDAETRVAQIEDFLRSEKPKKLFLWLHLFEPHEPYDEHEGFAFGDRDIDRYDSEIAYSDKVVGQVLALLHKWRPGAIVILTADHGEEFGEHGGRYHGTALYEEQERVPLIVRVPGLAPHVIAGPAEIIDIPATILGLLDLPLPLRMRGTDLGPWLGTPPAPEARLPPAFAEVEDKRMVVLGTEKLVCSIAKPYCNYFDLATDPGEKNDLADQRPDRVAALRQQIDTWLGQQARYEGKLLGAAGGTGDLAHLIERGRLGEARAAKPLAQSLLTDAPVAARREAARLLVTTLPPRDEARDALVAVLSKPGDAEILSWAAVAALRVGVTEALARVHALVFEPENDANSLLFSYAALALADKSDRAAIPVLAQGLGTCGEDILLCRRIIAALGRSRDPAAVPALVGYLDVVLTRRETVEALAKIARPEVLTPLVGCLEEDPYVDVRVSAAKGLGRLGGAHAVQALRTALKHEREEAVLSAVREALAGLGRGKQHASRR